MSEDTPKVPGWKTTLSLPLPRSKMPLVELNWVPEERLLSGTRVRLIPWLTDW